MERLLLELAQAKAELEASRLKTDAMLDSLGEGLIVTDAQGMITTVNHYALKALGYSEPVAHKHTADPRIRRGAVLTFPGQCQRMLHPVFFGWGGCGHALLTSHLPLGTFFGRGADFGFAGI